MVGIYNHPFVATPNKGKCSSCGLTRSHPVHKEVAGGDILTFRNRERAIRYLQHAEWHCLYGSGGDYNSVERAPDLCDMEAAAKLRELREEISKSL